MNSTLLFTSLKSGNLLSKDILAKIGFKTLILNKITTRPGSENTDRGTRKVRNQTKETREPTKEAIQRDSKDYIGNRESKSMKTN